MLPNPNHPRRAARPSTTLVILSLGCLSLSLLHPQWLANLNAQYGDYGDDTGLINLSTLTIVPPESVDPGIKAGFIIGDDGQEFLLLGENFGGMDPRLILENFDTGEVIASNGSWTTAPNDERIDNLIRGPLGRPTSLAGNDAALLLQLDRGAYVARLEDETGSLGVQGIVAINDVAGFTTGRASEVLLNLSTNAGIPPEGMRSGFIVVGDTAQDYLLLGENINGLNPFLTLETLDGTLLASNDNWLDAPEASVIDTTLRFELGRPTPLDQEDAAILITLEPGTYIVRLRDALERSGTEGIVAINNLSAIEALTDGN